MNLAVQPRANWRGQDGFAQGSPVHRMVEPVLPRTRPETAVPHALCALPRSAILRPIDLHPWIPTGPFSGPLPMSSAEKTRPVQRGTLTSHSFIGYLVTQFLGAVNDNMFRWLVVPIAKVQVGEAREAVVLSAGLACFVLPYILLTPYAGWLADRFSKRNVIVGCKGAEIVIMLLGVAAILAGNLWLLFLIVALMGSQSALFGPSKLGAIPELVTTDRISKANGLVGLTTVVAVVIGTVLGTQLFSIMDLAALSNLWLPAVALIGTAALGWLASLLIRPLPAANPVCVFPTNPAASTWNNLKFLCSDRPTLRVALGIAFFWSMAALAQLNIDTYTIHELERTQREVGPLLGVLALGVGVGSVLAGLWSGGKVELGIVPLAALVIAASSLLLHTTGESYWWTALLLFLLGAGGGMFDVPLVSWLQHHGPREKLGTILAGSNLLTFTGMLGVSLLFAFLQDVLRLDATTVFLIAGIGTVPIALYVFFLVPQASLRCIAWLASRTVYRVRVRGIENLPQTGGALLVANHASWIDGILVLTTSSRPIRMLAFADYVEKPGLRWLARLFSVIPIKSTAGPKALLRSLRSARDAVNDGELVCIFPEGTITRTGQLLPFQRGMLRIVEGTDAPVIPVYLDELWGSIFSFSGGKFFWKSPQQWPYPVTISFGRPVHAADNVNQVRRAVQDLGVQSMEARKSRQMIPARRFLRQCRSGLFRWKIADSGGTVLNGGKLLTGTLVMKRLLERHVLARDEKMVGLLLPPSVGGTVANAAVTLAGRVAVNLNYTLSNDVVNFCVRQSGLKHVLTSRRFLEKRPFDLDAELVFLEDLKDQATGFEKLRSLCAAFGLPACILERLLGLTRVDPDELLTVIFTSGSTGEPKGVMLSHFNVLSNIAAVEGLFHLDRNDVLLGVLPFFHSFGFTVTLWLPLSADPRSVYHFNPLDARTIGKLSRRHGVTIIVATPTFLRTYLKRCDAEQMRTLNLVIVGAEKLPTDLAAAFRDKFGVEPTEGYGTTELSPVASFNVPPDRTGSPDQLGTKPGTVGRVMPGASAKVVNPDTGAELDVDQEGLLRIKGPNVMLGYLNAPDKTAAVIDDGWYDTGDFAKIDNEGFIQITGRQSRFSKIGGEMVPHLRVEEELARIVDDPDNDEPEILVAVTSVPDEKKGERLIVLHKPLPEPVDDVLGRLADASLPNIWLPGRDCFFEVAEIPLLGTGKLDLRAIGDLARELTERTATSD